MARKHWVNRFPVCAMVYREAAEILGYDPNEAKSLGLARAIFFAAAKSGFRRAGARPKYYPGKQYAEKAESQRANLRGYDTGSIESLNFAGMSSYVIHTEDGSVRGFIGEQPIKPENFDRQVKDKCIRQGGGEAYTKLKLYIVKKLSKLNRYEVNSAAVFEVYKDMRDEVRKEEFLQGEEDVGLSAETNVDPT